METQLDARSTCEGKIIECGYRVLPVWQPQGLAALREDCSHSREPPTSMADSKFNPGTQEQ